MWYDVFSNIVGEDILKYVLNNWYLEFKREDIGFKEME